MDGRHIVVGKERQLFLDDLWTSDASGVSRVLHTPERREEVLIPDSPWERHGMPSCVGYFRDGDRYRMWYRCDDTAEGNPRFTAYAESQDGIHWEKPNLGIVEYEGSKDNNLVSLGDQGMDLTPFRDDNPNAADDEHYKGVVRPHAGKAMYAVVSPDGLRWRLKQPEPILDDPPFDTQNIAFWDTWREEYVFYTRGVRNPTPEEASEPGKDTFIGGVRWIRRATSDDFVHWSKLESITAGDTPTEHLYTNSCVQYPRSRGTYLMFPSRFVPERSPTPGWPSGPGVNDIVFMSSRDGLNFDRSFMEAFIRPGPGMANWHERAVYFDWGLLQTSPTELSMYCQEHGRLPTAHLRRYTLRTDGFVSVQAGFEGGEFLTQPLVFEGGELEMNYSTSAVGSVQVEIQDAEGRAIPGYGLDECPEKFGDEIEGTMGWNAGSGVGNLAGRPVRLRFALKDADMYAFRFR